MTRTDNPSFKLISLFYIFAKTAREKTTVAVLKSLLIFAVESIDPAICDRDF
jgi:hypothetical protein